MSESRKSDQDGQDDQECSSDHRLYTTIQL